MAQVLGLVFRSSDMLNLKLFYETLGVSLTQEKHGGPSHFSFPVDKRFIAEIYQSNGEGGADALVIGVESIALSLEKLRSKGFVIKSEPKGQTNVTIQDPDGRNILLMPLK